MLTSTDNTDTDTDNRTDADIMPGVNRLMDRFNLVPQGWASLIATHIDEEEYVAMPMYGSLFKTDDSGMASLVSDLLSTEDAEVPATALGIIAFAEEKGFNIEDDELRLLALASRDDEDEDDIDADIERIREDLMEQWQEEGGEDRNLYDSGWQDVGGTGFVAREFDGHLMLGVNGCGYDFRTTHWANLYQELGLNWHPTEEAE